MELAGCVCVLREEEGGILRREEEETANTKAQRLERCEKAELVQPG